MKEDQMTKKNQQKNTPTKKKQQRLITMYNALHMRNDMDRLHVSKKTTNKLGRPIAINEGGVDASIQGLEKYIKKNRERLIMTVINRNGNLWPYRKKTEKIKWNKNNMVALNDKLVRLFMRRFRHSYKREASKKTSSVSGCETLVKSKVIIIFMIITGTLGKIPKRIGNRTGRLSCKRTRGDHPNYSIKIGLNTEKSPGELRSLAVTQTPVKNHQLTLVWKKSQMSKIIIIMVIIIIPR